MIIKVTDPNTKKEYEFYMDKKLYEQIDNKVRKSITNKDEDYIIVVDGGERTGKSVFAQQIAKALDPTFNMERMCLNPEEFRRAILEAKPYQAIVFDEAYRGFASRGALSEVNRLLVSLMMEMGQKNLFVIVVLPTFFLLEKYVALWRSKGLFHIYKLKGKKGFWRFYNKKKKKLLYLTGKKDYTYNQKTKMKGRFTNYYVFDEQEYRQKKKEALEKGYKTKLTNKYLKQRNIVIMALKREKRASNAETSEILARYGLDITEEMVRLISNKEKPKEHPPNQEITPTAAPTPP